MRSKWLVLFAGLFLSAAVGLADGGPIRLPQPPAVPSPMPPAPGTVLVLSGELLYVADCKVDCVLLARPAGLVKVTKEAGPIRIRGRFVDGPGKVETRTYAGPVVYVIEPAGKGRVYLDFVPMGFKGEGEIVSDVLDVDPGITPPGPKPPEPTPDPKPPEPNPAPIPEKGLRVLVVVETNDAAKMPAAQQAVVYSAKVRGELNKLCVLGPDGRTREWRMWDQDTPVGGESKLWQAAMGRKRDSLPWLLVSNGVTGYEGPLPETADKFLELVGRYK